MSDRSFVRAMFEGGHHEWSWAFACGYLMTAIAAWTRGMCTSGQLSRMYHEVDHARNVYIALEREALDHDDLVDGFRRWALQAPVGSDSPAGEGPTPR